MSGTRAAVTDLVDGIRSVHMWSTLGWQEVKQRYRRSTLGPLWLTISTGIMLSVMGPLYGALFGQDTRSYFLYLAVGFVAWQLISQMCSDGCMVFIGSEGFIKSVRLPLTIHVLRSIWKNIIIFFHNAIIAILVLLVFRPAIGWDIFLVPIALLLYALNGIWIGTVLGIVCARFRDIPQLVSNLVQISFFLTPVMWRPEMLGQREWLVHFNPFYHFIDILRRPLIGEGVNPSSWIIALLVTVSGFLVMIPFFARYRPRVAYWI